MTTPRDLTDLDPKAPAQIPGVASSEAPIAVASASARRIKQLSWRDPLIWLVRGGRDLLGEWTLTVFFGAWFWLLAVVVATVFHNKPEYTMSIVSGCFLIGPFLAMGLYEVSRRRELGQPGQFVASLTCWRNHLPSMGLLLLVLTMLELIWGRASLVVFALFFDTGMPTAASVFSAVFNPSNWEFVAVYLLVGGAFAALVFSTCLVSIPMILDRDVDAVSAAITSMQVVLANLPVILLWGLLIVALVIVALLPWGAGLVIVGPWLGYATWHAYRGAIHWHEGVTAYSGTQDAPARDG